MKSISKAIDQQPTGEDGNHRVGCCTAMWKERKYHHIMISKQQPKYYDGIRAQPGDRYGSGTLHPGQVLRGSLPLLSPYICIYIYIYIYGRI